MPIETTRLRDPPGGVELVDEEAGGAGLAPAAAPYGVTRTVGDVTLQVLWPPPDSPTIGPGDGSTANEASVVLLVEVRGVRLLLAGDVEPEGQARLRPAAARPARRRPQGARTTAAATRTSTSCSRSGARLALVSVGADNDYGHPAASTLAPLAATGARVLRTDLDGDLVVVERDGRLSAVTGD